MKYRISDNELDDKLRAYMTSGGEQAFQLDESRVLGIEPTRNKVWALRKAHVAAAVLLVLIISVVAIPQISSAFSRLFSFIPGVGIVEKSDILFYVMSPVVREVESDDLKAAAILGNAVYSSGHLNISVTINGWYVGETNVELEQRLRNLSNNFSLFINGEQCDFQSTASATMDSALSGLQMWIMMNTPNSDDLFEVRIEGFSTPLSFTIIACQDYNDLADIGPTDTHNGISITTTTYRDNNKLIVQYYPFNTRQDWFIGFGNPLPANYKTWVNETYIITGNGLISVNSTDINSSGTTFVFDMPSDDDSATLHIPYVTMWRHEEKKITVPIPQDYSFIECNVSVKTSLGTIRVTGVERAPSLDDTGGEVLRIYFDFDSNEDGVLLGSILDYQLHYPKSWVKPRIDPHIYEDGRRPAIPDWLFTNDYYDDSNCLEYIEIGFLEYGKPAKNLSLTTLYLGYYLLDEYVIPLDIAE